ncbi:MAG: Respiratory nitrate reductase 1 alpha chain [Candidatus Omnitrophica bacterium]|nr:Respiratory nitrate reductase 1 alpha chain [Candidatus Omnitrophota bacterium]
MGWIEDIFSPKERTWEDHYRNRWAYDKIVRSTHGVNCTGSCSWNIHVKQGIVTWETQALDYPRIDATIPPYEPRGCQRGISYSWYIYSPLRVKYPLVRGVLLDLWKEAKKEHPEDLVAAWASIVEDPDRRARYQSARGKGGFRRVTWDVALEIMAVANIYTVRRYGPDRLAGFSPIPAMSMISYAGGARFMQLMGGVSMSFYDWYCDLPPASPEIWGEQTDVAESADWYKSKMIAVVGSNVFMTRTPDAHYLVEARHHGTKVVVFSPDFSQTSKAADEWIPLHQGQDAAYWLAVGHVILKEYYLDREVPYFLRYLKQYSDAAFLVKLERQPNGHYRPGELLRASDVERTAGTDNAEWKFFVQHAGTGELKMPMGTVGHRWQEKKGQWNLKLEDALTGEPIDPALRLGSAAESEALIEVPDFSAGTDGKVGVRGVPCRKVATVGGQTLVTTVFELLLAQYGVLHGKSMEWPKSYEDESGIYTPAWQEKFTGVSAANVVQFARQWAETAERSEGRCSVIIGAGVNHWYHNNLIYRAVIMPLIFCGCVGRNGGGWNHYVGQEKLAPMASWAPVAFATDWGGPPRLQNTPSFHYMHTDQWRYDNTIQQVCPTSSEGHCMTHGHTADKQALAVRAGWLPCYPQFNRSNLEVARDARAQGANTAEEIRAHVVKELVSRRLRFAMEDPDNPESFPRVWYIWRGNALLSSAKGHEYFLKHYLGTHHNSIAKENAKNKTEDVVWHDRMPVGKMDLVIDLNYRMDSSALYSDVVLPAATYYEKDDLNSTDMHTFIHPLQAAVPPCWESKSDWAAFREIARKTSELAEKYLPDPIEDIVTTPLTHDTPAEIAQRSIRDWAKGECEAIPGKTMPGVTVVERRYPEVYRKYVSLGPVYRDKGLGIHGLTYPVSDIYDRYLETHPVERWGDRRYPSLHEDRSVCEVILAFAAETNGELAYRAYEQESRKTGMDLQHLAKDNRSVRLSFQDLVASPKRLLTTPFWTGVVNNGRTYAAFCQNTEELIPWRTLTGRQHLYLDHEAYRAYGEELPTYKPRLEVRSTQDLDETERGPGMLMLNYLTPHGKWHIHSTYGDTLTMKTLSRGIEPVWINDTDAAMAGIRDNDWVEVLNDHGVVVTRACVSARIPRGLCFIYHAVERTVGVPRSPSRGDRRAGGHNSLTRARLKPLFMIGGYGQFSYGFNYWGPQGVNRDTFVLVRRLGEVKW